MSHREMVQEMGKRARAASHRMARVGSTVKRDVLLRMAEMLDRNDRASLRPTPRTSMQPRRKGCREPSWIDCA